MSGGPLNPIAYGGPTWGQRLEWAAREAKGRSYRVPPAKHSGHVVTFGDLDPPDPTHVLCTCECGATWAMDGARAKAALERGEVKP